MKLTCVRSIVKADKGRDEVSHVIILVNIPSTIPTFTKKYIRLWDGWLWDGWLWEIIRDCEMVDEMVRLWDGRSSHPISFSHLSPITALSAGTKHPIWAR